MLHWVYFGYERQAMTEIEFKEAKTAEEIEQIHRLNHRIFAEEIRQHPQTSDGRLIDRYHDCNRYFIASERGVLAGMISAHDGPNFSVARRLKDPAALSSLRAPLEIRLLAILPEFRNRSVLAGLFWQVFDYARAHDYSDLLISGIVDRLPMYEKIGFSPMGPPVPDGTASFVPMRISLESAPPEFCSRSRLYGSRWQRNHPVSLLPGPVAISEQVARAFQRPPVSHRSGPFIATYEETRSQLSALMGNMQSVILGGSGTLANDAVAANLRAAFGSREGLVIANGEFGERLIRQAARAGLLFRDLRIAWGDCWNFKEIEQELRRRPAWIWAVHLETSTGVLNDLPCLIDLARQRDIPVAADCVSSLGAVDTCFPGLPHRESLFLATGVSGKALGAYAGMAFAFLSEQAIERLHGKELCPSFDLLEAARARGPLSTVSSPLLLAVREALRKDYSEASRRQARYAHCSQLGRWTRAQIREAGLVPLAREEFAAPTITTFALPSASFPRQCLRAGYKIAHESDYLDSRGWGQIATMGNLDQATLEPLFQSLHA
jgi:aspartate aminotransferase-like enzyme